MKSESPFKWAVPDNHHNVAHRCLPHQIVHLQIDQLHGGLQRSQNIKTGLWRVLEGVLRKGKKVQ